MAAWPGAKPVRGEVRISRVLVAVRMFLSFAVVNKEAPSWVLGMIYGPADNRDLPLEAQSEAVGFSTGCAPDTACRNRIPSVDRATDEEIVALFAACQSAWDRLIVLLLARAGLRRSDLHLLPDNRSMGCAIEGAAHSRRPPGERQRRLGEVPAHPQGAGGDFLLVLAIDQYLLERQDCPAATASDFLLVNLFRAPLGGPVLTGSTSCSRRCASAPS
jgi:integrase/recombinase XerD